MARAKLLFEEITPDPLSAEYAPDYRQAESEELGMGYEAADPFSMANVEMPVSFRFLTGGGANIRQHLVSIEGLTEEMPKAV